MRAIDCNIVIFSSYFYCLQCFLLLLLPQRQKMTKPLALCVLFSLSFSDQNRLIFFQMNLFLCPLNYFLYTYTFKKNRQNTTYMCFTNPLVVSSVRWWCSDFCFRIEYFPVRVRCITYLLNHIPLSSPFSDINWKWQIRVLRRM